MTCEDKGEVLGRGEYISTKTGHLVLVWDNTYSLITGQEFVVRLSVKR